jgi:sugar phosphate isomerase/epimerase
MRLGGKVFEEAADPQAWAEAVRRLGYRAAYCPVDADADDETVRAYAEAASRADVVIAEVGAWSNTISPDEDERRANVAKCVRRLELAERIGARCCVNIVGSRGGQWNGPHPDNVSEATFDLIVQTVREIVDGVRPTRTAYTLEMMGWGLPDSAETYLELIRAVDRGGFGAHLDPVNLINSPRRYYDNARLLKHTIGALGPHIRSCHAKDVQLSGKHLVHLDEVRPGRGALDYGTYLRELAKLDADLPVMLEHLPDAGEYAAAAEHLRAVAAREGLSL